VQCVYDGECSGAEPLCEIASHTCIPCTNVGDNAEDNAACDAKTDGTVCVSTGGSAGQCRGCDPADDDGCSGTNDQCNGTSFTCVDCIGAAGCTMGNVCIDGGNTCVECNEPADCDEPTPACSANECVECTSSTNCMDTPATPLCNTTSNECVECLTQAQCVTGNQACVSNDCRACTVDSQCAGHPTGPECANVGGTNECRECDPGLLGSTLDDQGCEATEVCNETTFVCE
jgi:hypothetical protein